MKKAILFFMLTIGIVSCSKHTELFEKTDFFVKELNSNIQTYGLQGFDDTQYTKDGMYKITPVGRLINVRIEKAVDESEYEKLRGELESHYKGDARVNRVYINQGGTIMIDCRN